MAKRRKRKPSHAYKDCPEPTQCKPTAEQFTIRRWFSRLDRDVCCALIRQTRGMTSAETAAVYRQAWIDAGRPG